MNKEYLLFENQRRIDKAKSKIVDGIDLDYWESELDTLRNERMIIEGDLWQ